MTIDDEIWLRLSAYHDGELDKAETAAVRAELRGDPALQAVLREISDLSAALKPLAPGRPAAFPMASVRRWAVPGVLMALAASVVILVGSIQAERPEAERTPFEWHTAFASQTYQSQSSATESPALRMINHTYDLSSANLTLVDVALLESGDSYLHYTGVNGCRLTVGSFSAKPTLLKAPSEFDLHRWTVGNVHYVILAQGMDAGKFAAIAQLLEIQTEGRPARGDVLLAMRDATSDAVPCA